MNSSNTDQLLYSNWHSTIRNAPPSLTLFTLPFFSPLPLHFNPYLGEAGTVVVDGGDVQGAALRETWEEGLAGAECGCADVEDELVKKMGVVELTG